MAKYLLFLLTLALLAASTRGAVASTTDDNLAQRQETMAQVVRLGANPKLAAAADPKTIHRLALFLKREMGPIETILQAIRKMPESSATEVRIKDEAFEAAMDLLSRHLRVLLPHGCAACANTYDAVGKMPENGTDDAGNSAAKVLGKEKVKELMNRHLDQLLPAAGSVKMEDDQ